MRSEASASCSASSSARSSSRSCSGQVTATSNGSSPGSGAGCNHSCWSQDFEPPKPWNGSRSGSPGARSGSARASWCSRSLPAHRPGRRTADRAIRGVAVLHDALTRLGARGAASALVRRRVAGSSDTTASWTTRSRSASTRSRSTSTSRSPTTRPPSSTATPHPRGATPCHSRHPTKRRPDHDHPPHLTAQHRPLQVQPPAIRGNERAQRGPG